MKTAAPVAQQSINDIESWEIIYSSAMNNIRNVHIKDPEIKQYFHDLIKEKDENENENEKPDILKDQIQELRKENEKLQEQININKAKINKYKDGSVNNVIQFKIRMLLRNNGDHYISSLKEKNDQLEVQQSKIESLLNSKEITDLLNHASEIPTQILNDFTSPDLLEDRMNSIAKFIKNQS